MNGKASVSKELNDKQRKILEALLKLPENRECADCKSRGPRWASVNLGIFICLQCSGIHRSLGVHISKVRSATLDTWLPEQISFIQSMGNERSNANWEAELPPNYNRTGIESFIRAKYVEKRWISRNGVVKLPVNSAQQPGPSIPGSELKNGSRRSNLNGFRHVSEEKTSKAIVTATENRSPKPVNVTPPVHGSSIQAIYGGAKPQEQVPETKPAFSKIETIKQQTVSPPALLPTKVDYATELFQLLCANDSKPNNISPQDAATALCLPASQEKQVLATTIPDPTPRPPNQQPTRPCPTNTAKYSYGAGYYTAQSYTTQGRTIINRATNGIQTPVGDPNMSRQNLRLNLPRVESYPSSGTGIPQIGNSPQLKIGSSPYSSPSAYYPIQGPPIGGAMTMSPRFKPSPKPRPAITPTQSGWDYDFSALTQGLFAKR
ncbi:hypothetical protein MLD38_019359 [Melastoma candidum]|uniref:Uncharacterized protein n=1 Tax=Melastoma candidum TaxID=119954 RepID=A0ACB9R0U1_9MYRT|nr:hypothetical protein MLD38_019359 [Melastoma candidum]